MPEVVFWQEVVIPIAGMLTGVVIVAIVANLVRHARKQSAATSPDRAGDTEALRSEVQELRSHVEVLEERLDFTERLLTRERTRQQVEPG